MHKYNDMEIKNSLDCTLLQADLDNIYEKSVTWRILIVLNVKFLLLVVVRHQYYLIVW